MSFISTFIIILCHVLTIAMLARAFVSWFPVNPGNQLIVFLYQITEPILAPLRRIIPRIRMVDITPMIAVILLQYVIIPLAGRLG